MVRSIMYNIDVEMAASEKMMLEISRYTRIYLTFPMNTWNRGIKRSCFPIYELHFCLVLRFWAQYVYKEH